MKQLFFVLAGWLWLSCLEASDAARDSWRVCFLNLQNYRVESNHSEASGSESFKSKESLRQLETLIGQIAPDVLALSEIGHEQDLRYLQLQLSQQGLPLPYAAFTHGADPHRQLAILSKFPLRVETPESMLRYELAGKVHLMSRGLLDVVILPEASPPWRLLVAHLKSQREVSDGDQAWMRRSEAYLVRKHLEARMLDAPSMPLVLCGDFNDHKNQATIRSLEGKRGHSFHTPTLRCEDDRGQVWTHYWKDADLYSRFDYFFLNSAAQKWLKQKKGRIGDLISATDHRPIWLDLKPTRDNRSRQETPSATLLETQDPS